MTHILILLTQCHSLSRNSDKMNKKNNFLQVFLALSINLFLGWNHTIKFFAQFSTINVF